MKKFNGTKGEWTINLDIEPNEYGSMEIKIDCHDSGIIHMVSIWCGSDVTEESIANARLIAAAPDLLEALIILMSGVAALPPLSPINGVLKAQYELAEKAVKKALGE